MPGLWPSAATTSCGRARGGSAPCAVGGRSGGACLPLSAAPGQPPCCGRGGPRPSPGGGGGTEEGIGGCSLRTWCGAIDAAPTLRWSLKASRLSAPACPATGRAGGGRSSWRRCAPVGTPRRELTLAPRVLSRDGISWPRAPGMPRRCPVSPEGSSSSDDQRTTVRRALARAPLAVAAPSASLTPSWRPWWCAAVTPSMGKWLAARRRRRVPGREWRPPLPPPSWPFLPALLCRIPRWLPAAAAAGRRRRRPLLLSAGPPSMRGSERDWLAQRLQWLMMLPSRPRALMYRVAARAPSRRDLPPPAGGAASGGRYSAALSAHRRWRPVAQQPWRRSSNWDGGGAPWWRWQWPPLVFRGCAAVPTLPRAAAVPH